MEMQIPRTNIFKNIFPDYETFKTWYKSTPLCDGDSDIPSIKTFTLIAYEYNCSHVCMSDEDFRQHFANDLYTFYKEFEATTKSIIDLMNLTDEQISQADSMITNTAVTPETESSTNATEVDFITQQQKVINKKGELQIRKEQLSSKRAFTVRAFLNKFRHLFITIISSAYTDVYVEYTED